MRNLEKELFWLVDRRADLVCAGLTNPRQFGDLVGRIVRVIHLPDDHPEIKAVAAEIRRLRKVWEAHWRGQDD